VIGLLALRRLGLTWRPPRLPRPSEDTLIDAAFVVGLAAIAFGCGWMYRPLGAIVGGILLVGSAWRISKAGDLEEPSTKQREVWYSQAQDEDD
jgi:hypothetical protein